MKLVDEIIIDHQGAKHAIQLLIGDLAALSPSEAVDILVVSAFPGSYKPTKTSLVGALDAVGVSVNELASNKAVDLRTMSSCWLSQEIHKPNIHFKRILCFEPAIRGRAPELVGDIFRSVIPFAAGPTPVSTIAMPIVASGDQGESRVMMLESIVRASMHWLSIGLPIDCIRIVHRDQTHETELRGVFERIRAESNIVSQQPSGAQRWRYDAFVSYARADKAAVDTLVDAMIQARGPLRIFVDQMELQTGAAWQQHIYEALDDCQKVITMLSPGYLSSKVCKEEFNIALFRHRESKDGVLLPVYLRTAELPTYMKLIQFEDVREGDPARLSEVARKLSSRI